jgi:uncharacterized protein YcbX
MTPVKGMALVHPEAAELTSRGIPANRRFYLIDADGGLFSTTHHGPLVSVVPTYDPERERLGMRFPDGTEIEGDTASAGEPVSTLFYGRAVRGRIVEGPWSAALSRFVGRPLRLVRAETDGDATDVEPLTIVSTASVADLGARGHHDGPLDARRFRLDVELDGLVPFEEDTWEGDRVQIGGAIVRVLGQIPRCRVTTRDPDTGAHDWDTLTQIAKLRPRIRGDGGLPFGMYARVERPGPVRLGDAVEVVGSPALGPAVGSNL